MPVVIQRERRRRRSRLWGRVPRLWRLPLLAGVVLITILVLSIVHGSLSVPRVHELPPEFEQPL